MQRPNPYLKFQVSHCSSSTSDDGEVFVESPQDAYPGSQGDGSSTMALHNFFRSHSMSERHQARQPRLSQSVASPGRVLAVERGSVDMPSSKENIGDKVKKVLLRSFSCAPAEDNTHAYRRGSERSEQILDLFAGNMENLPEIPSKTIRIFLSSTFSDFKAERNILYQSAYPKLQQVCSEKGLEFQVLDLRWGVTDDVINDHQVSQLCLDEIVNCQKVSCGPNFVVMLGNRYGYQTFPSQLDEDKFCIIRDIAQELNLPKQHLLLEWFIKDVNADNPVYILQPIPSKLKYYNSTDEILQNERAEHRRQWNDTFQALKSIFRDAVNVAFKSGLVSAEFKQKFYLSVTEEEIHQGLFIVDECERDRALCYIRSLESIKECDLTTPNLQDFIDLLDKDDVQLDTVAQRQRDVLVEEKVPSALCADNMKEYTVRWQADLAKGFLTKEYSEYLEKFASDFMNDIERQIDSHLDKETDVYGSKGMYGLYTEVLHHAKFALHKCEVFCGREALLNKICSYVTRKHTLNSSAPFIVTGDSGFGKTALMAKAALCVPGWLAKHHRRSVTAVRFMGTSPESTNIQGVLKSLIIQICYVYRLPLPKEESLEKIGDLTREFLNTLKWVSNSPSHQVLVILLDAVDQLLSRFSAHKMSWLPKNLPPNVYMVISMLSNDQYSCLNHCQRRLNVTPDITLTSMSETTADKVIDCRLRRCKRQLTSEQRHLVLTAFQNYKQPLYLKLVLDEASTWYSYTPCRMITVPSNVHEMIVRLFQGLEFKYGERFVRHALSYLTCGRSGLSSVEMEDVLSCDNEVLNDVYQYHDPPIDGIIRIPSLMWARLQHDLKEYLAQRYVDGKNVYAWYHRQFWEAAECRYLKNSQDLHKYHTALAEIFIQETGIKKSIVLEQRRNKVIQHASRCVTPQPMCSRNMRKLNCMPYHLFRAERYEDMRKQCLINYRWLYNKLKSQGISRLLRDFEFWCDNQELTQSSPDVLIMRDFLQQCYNSLAYSCSLLAFHIKERLSTCMQRTELIQRLVRDADKWVKSTGKPLLLPTIPTGLPTVDSPLRLSMLAGFNGMVDTAEHFVVCQWNEQNSISKLKTLDLYTRDIVASIDTEKSAPFVLTPDNLHVVYAGSLNIEIHEVDTGDLVHKFKYHSRRNCEVTIRCIAIDSNGRYLAVGVRFGKPKRPQKQGWSREVFIYLISLHEHCALADANMPSRQQVQDVYFVDGGGEKLIAVSRDLIVTFEVPTMKVLHKLENFGEIHQHVLTVCHTINRLLAGVQHERYAKVMYYDFKTYKHSYSSSLNSNINAVKDRTELFGIKCSNDGMNVLLGCFTKLIDKGSTEHVLSWLNLEDNSVKKIGLGKKQLNSQLCSMTVSDNWELAFLGWQNGSIAIVKLREWKQLKLFQAHHHSINNMILLENDRKLLTFSQDHNVKVWDIDALLASSLQPMVSVDSGFCSQSSYESSQTSYDSGQSNCSQDSVDAASQEMLDNKTDYVYENEDCLDMDVTDELLLTCPPDTTSAFKMWSLEKGDLRPGYPELAKKYEETLHTSNAQHQGKTHAAISMLHGLQDNIGNQLFFYERTQRDSICVSVCAINTFSQESQILNLERFNDTFVHLLFPSNSKTKSLIQDTNMYSIAMMREKRLEIRSIPDLKLEQSIEIPSIRDSIPDITSSTSKRRLMAYGISITTDRKYLIISSTKTKDKYMDIIDLEEEKYVERVHLPDVVYTNFITDGIHFFVVFDEKFVKSQEETGHRMHHFARIVAVKPSCFEELNPLGCQYEYRAPLYNNSNFMSKDGTLGIEIDNHENIFCLWDLRSLKKLRIFEGHLHDITSVHISCENNMIVSGSYDKTIRLWNIDTGYCICLFHTAGAIDKVRFSPHAQYVVALNYAAPQSKRAIIFKVQNMKRCSSGMVC